MSDPRDASPDDSDNGPALLTRIRPIAAFVFGAIAIGTIFSIAYTGLSVAMEIWQRMHGQ
jgi:hypothetical protein